MNARISGQKRPQLGLRKFSDLKVQITKFAAGLADKLSEIRRIKIAALFAFPRFQNRNIECFRDTMEPFFGAAKLGGFQPGSFPLFREMPGLCRGPFRDCSS